jgi:hypothetical protein
MSVCDTRAHCGNCRSVHLGAGFRRSLIEFDPIIRFRHEEQLAAGVSGAAEQSLFTCPYGIPDTFVGHSREALAAMIEEHCTGCPHEVLSEAGSACRKFAGLNGQPCITRFWEELQAGAGCPIGRF